MRGSTTLINKNQLGLAIAALVAAAVLAIGWLAATANASSIVGVTTNVADVPGGQSLVITVTAQNDGDVYELEVDHSLDDTNPNPALYPEFSVYADEADPYGGDFAQFDALGVEVTYSAADSQWVIDFGPTVTQGIVDANGGPIAFYLVLKDTADKVLWGSMAAPTAESTFSYDLVDGTGDSLVPAPVVDEPTVPGVPNTSVGRQ